jgi:hypothetical protein
MAHNVCVNLYQGIPCYEWVTFAFRNLKEDDKLLAFLVDCHCSHWNPDADDEEEKILRAELPNAFLVQVMFKYYEMRDRRLTSKAVDICSYHDHKSDEERMVCEHYKRKKTKAKA